MTKALLMDTVYVGCGVIFGLIVRKLIVMYCKRQWVGLTDEEINTAAYNNHPLDGIRAFARAVESKLKEKNGF